MKSSLAQAATFLSTLASASIIPSSSTSPGSSAKDITTVAGTTGPDHVSIHFSAPCQGCFIGTDDGLELTLEIDSADEECTSSPPRLNGFPLVMNNGNAIASGHISFTSKPLNGLEEKEVHAFWESTCLKGEASILSVRFDDIAGHNQVKGSSGFTTSFKQKGQPKVLRLQDRPIEQIGDENICDMWLRPDNSSRLSVAPISLDPDTVDQLLEVQYAKLEALKSQIYELHEQVQMTEGTIVSLLKDEFRSCSSMKCLWETAKSKAPAICKLITSHFAHHKGRISGCTSGDAQSACSTQDEENIMPVEQDHPQTTKAAASVEEVKVEVVSTRTLPSPTASPNHNKVEEPPSPEPEPEGWQHPHPPFDGDHAPFEEPHGPPPGSPHHSQIGHDGPPPWFRPHGGPPHGPPGLAPFGNEMSNLHRPFRHRLVLTVMSLVLLIIVGGLLVVLIRKGCAAFRDPRRRAERAARREERQTKRLYHKAACKHRWRTWWKRYRRQATGDYEEKREMILEQEGLSEDSLQTQIRTLHDATDLVRKLVAAEEGRAQIDHRALPARYSQSYQSPYSTPEYDAGVGSSRHSDVPPTYVAPPPRYEEELEGEMTVVDGFTYTPSTSDDATESSIVDCSPRLSFETGRSTILTKDAQD